MSSVEFLLRDLASGDLSLRFFSLLKLEKLSIDETVADRLKEIRENEPDQTLKLYLSWILQSNSEDQEKIILEIEANLQAKQPDWLRLFFLLNQVESHRIDRVIGLIRKIDYEKLPQNLFSLLVGFFARHGQKEDEQLLSQWCHHTDPGILSMAVEGLSRLNPEKLRIHLVSFLHNPSVAIRSRAIRLLQKWYPDEALRHMTSMLASEDLEERRAAVSSAFFFPFEKIRLLILRLIFQEKDELLIKQAGNVLITNPDFDSAAKLAAIIVQRCASPSSALKAVFLQQIEFLQKSGLIKQSPVEFAEKLLLIAKNQLQAQRKKIASTVEEDAVQPQHAVNDNHQAILDGMGISIQLNNVSQAEFSKNLPNFEARFPELPPALGALLIEKRVELEIDNTASWLKRVLMSSPPAEIYVGAIEGLSVLEPEFLRPYMTSLLRHSQARVQLAALSALARIEPDKAQKLIEQYLNSSSPERRKSGFRVLAYLEKTFAEPLIIKGFAMETDKEVLLYLGELIGREISQEFLNALFAASRTNFSSHEIRLEFLQNMLVESGLKMPEPVSKEDVEPELVLENVQMKLAEAESGQSRSFDQNDVSAKSANTKDFQGEYENLPDLEKLLFLNKISGSVISAEILQQVELLICTEKGRLQNFALQVIKKEVELCRNDLFSPVALLRQNLNRKSPHWVELAVGFSSLFGRAAKLSANLLLHHDWLNWPLEVIPYVLGFIRRTADPTFSRQVTALLKNPLPEIRYFAIDCLDLINADELKPFLVEILSDDDSNVYVRAIRVLAKWDKPESIRFFSAALMSDEKRETTAALSAGYFFPFSDIRSSLLAFIARSDDLSQIGLAAKIVLVNPDLISLKSLIEIVERSSDEKKNFLNAVLNDLLKLVCDCKLVDGSPTDIHKKLVNDYRATRQKEILERSLSGINSQHVEVRKDSINQLIRLHFDGEDSASSALLRRLDQEKDESLAQLIKDALIQTEEQLEGLEIELTKMNLGQRLCWYRGIDSRELQEQRIEILKTLETADLLEIRGILQVFLRFPEIENSAVFSSYFKHSDPEIVALAIEGVSSSNPSILTNLWSSFLSSNHAEIKIATIKSLFVHNRNVAVNQLEQWVCSKKSSDRSLAVMCFSCLDYHSVKTFLFGLLHKETEEPIFQQLNLFIRLNLNLELLEEIAFSVACAEKERLAMLEELLSDTVAVYCENHGIEARPFLEKLKLEAFERKKKELDPPDYSVAKITKIRAKQVKPSNVVKIELNPEKKVALAAIPISILVMAVIYHLVAGKSPQQVEVQIPKRPAVNSSQRFDRWKNKIEIGQKRIIFGRVEKVMADGLVIKSTVLNKTIYVRFTDKVPPLKENSHFSGNVLIESMNSEKIRALSLEK